MMHFSFFIVSFLLYTSRVCVLGRQKFVVLDNVLSDEDVKNVLNRFQEDDMLWNFHRLDVLSNDSEIFISKGAFQRTHNWMSRLTPSQFTERDGDMELVWTKLKQQIMATCSAEELHIHRVGAQISSRGDTVLSSRQCCGDSDRFNALLVLFLVPKWDKNSYGEMVIYGNDGEISKSIQPKPGRVALVPCGFNFTLRPPSMDCKKRLRTLTFHVSSMNPSPSHVFTREEQKVYMKEMYNLHGFQSLKSIPFDYPEFHIEKYITRQYKTAKGHPVVVFDDLISPDILESVADIMVSGMYNDNPPDESSSDSVQWILGFEVEALVASPLWHYAQAVAKYASKTDGYYPYDVSCNSIRSHDSTTIHLDCAPEQNEYTMLIYLNRNWTDNDHGETIFFDYNRKEMVFAIKPKFGRVAIFHGTIPHSARPPSPKLHGPRFTLAIKFAASKEEAFSKLLNLDIEPIKDYKSKAGMEEQVEIDQILADIKAGKIGKSETEKIVREYERKLMDF